MMEAGTAPVAERPPLQSVEGGGEGTDDQRQEPSQNGTGPATPPPADLPGDSEPDEGIEDTGLAIAGDRQLALKVGGRKPDVTELHLRGQKITVDGQFDRGDFIDVKVRLRVSGNHDDDAWDDSLQKVTNTKRKQIARVVTIERLPDEPTDAAA